MSKKQLSTTSQVGNSSSDDSSDDDEDPKGEEAFEYINASIIHDYFIKCGRVVQLTDIENMMNEVQSIFKIDGFDGKVDTKINLEIFYRFMTSFLQCEDEKHNH